MNNRVSSCLTHVLAYSLLFTLFVPGAIAQPSVQGQWRTLSNTLPINPVHVALLSNGRVLVVAGSGNCPPAQSGCPSGPPYGPSNGSGALLLDPVTGQTITQFSLSWDMFCNAMSLLPDGRVLIDSGTIQYDPFYGQKQVAIFDPATNSFTNVQNMAHGRWYPTLVTLGDGRVMTFSGLTETGGTNNAVEFYTVGSGWSTQYFAPWTPDLYPRLHLLPNGTVFYSGAGTGSKLFTPSTQSWNTFVAGTNYSSRTYGTSVLLPLTPANNYDPKVVIMGGGSPATKTTEIIDMGAATPQWVYGLNMSQARIEMNAVILPNGKVLALGGSVNDEDTNSLSLNADLFDLSTVDLTTTPPHVGTVSSAGANATQRLYHSVALLLPDATVWLAGGNPSRGTYNNTMEIYQPAYLFNSDGTMATRPSITSAPSSVSYGNAFSVTTPDAANISSVVLVRNGTATHAFGMDQREVVLSFTAGSGALTVTAPPNGNIAPPGYYMLFLLNNSGVPSQATFLQIGQQPDFSMSVSPSAQTVVQGSNTSYTVNVTALGGFSGTVGLSVSGLPTGATGSFNPTSVTGSGSSTLTVTTAGNTPTGLSTLTITGTAGTLTHQTAATLTVSSPVAPTVTSVSPSSGVLGGGTPVTITGANFASGATVTFGGTAATNVVVVNSTQITATTPAHAAGAVNVVVTNPNAQAGTLTNGFTYTSSVAITFAQIAASTQTAATQITVAFPGTQTIGNFNVVVVGWNDTTSTVQSVTDSAGNSYSLAIGPTSGTGQRQSIYYAANIKGGNNTVTVVFNQTAQYPDVRILEYQGVSALDVTAGASGNSGTSSSGTATTTTANELIFGAATVGTTVTGAGTGFTSRIITSFGDIAEDRVVTTTGSYSATAPLSPSSTWVMQMVAFKASSAPAPAVTTVSPSSGPAAGGTAVTITGTNFVPGVTVTLGGTAATNVVVTNATQITATTAAHAAGAVNVVVTNPDTQTGSLTNGYTYVAAPTITSVSPSSGPAAGGTAVAIAGANFVSGATVTLGGTPATNVVVTSTTQITATTAAHSAGAVNVVVTNPDTQNGTLINGFTYTSPTGPTITSVSPSSGTATGGTAVTITGTNFVSGATVTLGGTPATNVVVTTSTQITATTAAHAAGAVNVVVTNPDTQTGSLTNGYTYVAAPTITSVSPSSGPATGGTAVTLTGTSFVSGATVTLGGTPATNVVVTTSTQITATTAAHAAGAVTVVVTNPDTQTGSLTNGYTYLAAPTVTGVSPGSGPAAGGTAVTITGTNFVSGATVTLGGTPATNVVVRTSTQITATTAAHAAGAVTVVVSNPDTQTGSLTNGYTYVAAPTVTGVSPSSGPAAGGTAVTITGANFVSGATVTLGGTPATNVVVTSTTQIMATTAAHAAGAVNVVVTNPDTQTGTLTNGFTYLGLAPTVSSVSPSGGPAAGGTGVTITGTNFVSGGMVTLGGTPATSVVVTSSTQITATTATHAAGAVNVVVTNPDTQTGSLTNGYTYVAAPTVTSVSPSSGLAAGGTAVTITGTNFVSGATVTLGGTAATNVVVTSATQITATTSAHAAGAVNVVVANPDTQTGTLTNGYTYTTSVAITFGQVAASTQTAATQITVAFPGTQTIGNLNVVVVGWNDTTATVQSVTDTAGNQYSLAIGPTSGTGQRQSIYYAANIKGGNNTVTVVFNQTAQYPDVRILEYQGVSALDVTAGASGNSRTASSGTATTTTANELIFGAATVATKVKGAGTGFTSRIITSFGDIAEDRVVTTTGSYSATAPLTPSGTWVMQMVTFK